jgi:hypothetical protein
LGGTGELAVGTSAGEVVIYRWGGNKHYGRDAPPPIRVTRGGITDITPRSEPTLKEGLQPFVLYDMSQGPISALKVSSVGFIGVGSESGTFSIIDLRGPAVIFNAPISEFAKPEKHGGFMKRSSVQASGTNHATVIEFGVMTLEGDSYSSIGCFVGTNQGKVLTFKILPQQNGGYAAQFAGSVSFADKIISITPIVASTGQLALATGESVGALRDGQVTNGSLVVGKYRGPCEIRASQALTYLQQRKPKLVSLNLQRPREHIRNGTTFSVILPQLQTPLAVV